jgi:ATP-dependent DNA ligase
VSPGLTKSRRFHNVWSTAKRTRKSLKVKNAILDGEVICIDPDGRSKFKSLIRRRSKPMFYAFDLIWLNGTTCASFRSSSVKKDYAN